MAAPAGAMYVCGASEETIRHGNHVSTLTGHDAGGPLLCPHAGFIDADGNLYVSEWLIGGRYSKLIPKLPTR